MESRWSPWRFGTGAPGWSPTGTAPIGAYDPWIANHASPEQARRMFQGLGAVMPVHHSTFRLSREPVEEPIQRLLEAAGTEGWRVVAREIGATWAFPLGDGEGP